MVTEVTYDYVIVRVVPRVERGERVNVGVILSCVDAEFLDARIALDERRLCALDGGVDLEAVRAGLDSIRRICAGIVAEKSATFLSSGVSARIVSTSSAKPMLSISSASSRTRNRNSERSSVPLFRWSMTRPGVPTTTCTPRRRALSWTP